MIRRKVLSAVFAALAAFSTQTLASPVSYTLTFTADSQDGALSPLPTASVVYDNTARVFQSFVITWRNITFDLTSEANAPPNVGCPASDTGAQCFFDFISTNYNNRWEGDQQKSGDFFDLDGLPPNAWAQIYVTLPDTGMPAYPISAVGSFVIQSSTIPEPTSLALLSVGSVIVGVGAKKKKSAPDSRYPG